MEVNTYQKLAARTINPKLSNKDRLVNSMMGLCGEAGECSDIVKKHIFHEHPLDKESLIKELGDVAWYLAFAATALEVDLSDILEQNIEKLKRRYPEGFSSEKSIHRIEGEE